MKSIFVTTGFLLIAALLLPGCADDRCTRVEEFVEFQPVYKRIEEMRVPVEVQSPKALKTPGKIFYYNGYLLINELNEGIHIVDNRDPHNPTKVAFLDIPGNVDMAIRGQYLYADSYLDLVTIDLTNISAPAEVGRTNDVFQSFYSYTEEFGYLVEYEPTDVVRTLDCSNPNWGNAFWREGDMVLLSVNAEFGSWSPSAVSGNSSVSPSVIIGGSMARFTVAKDHLYAIDGQEVKVFDVAGIQPDLRNEVAMQWGIETLFPMAGTLFVGSNSGLLIYDISNPAAPEYRSTFSHATACDPVFVRDDIAYVTLRSGNACLGFNNQLDVINVSNLYNPKLIKSYPMDHPHGLSVVGSSLYLCEGAFGLKVFDLANLERIDQNQLDHVTGFDAYDVIVLPPGDLVMVIGQDGFYQYDASDRNDLKQISVIRKEE